MTAIGLNYVWANVITRQATKANAGRGVFPDYYPGISIISNRVLGYQTKTVPIQNDSCSCKFDNVVIDLYRAASDMDTVSSWTLNHISLNLGRATSVDPNAILSSRNAEPLYDGPLAPHKNSTLFRIWRFDCRFSLTSMVIRWISWCTRMFSLHVPTTCRISPGLALSTFGCSLSPALQSTVSVAASPNIGTSQMIATKPTPAVYHLSLHRFHDIALQALPKGVKHVNGDGAPKLHHFCVYVDSNDIIEKIYPVLKRRKIPIVSGPETLVVAGNRSISFLDPDGNRVEIACNANKFKHDNRKRGKHNDNVEDGC